MNKLKVAVVGLGNMGRHHVRNYSEIPEAELVAVCDQNQDRLKEFSTTYQVKGYQDLAEMIEGCDLDAVNITASTTHHYELAMLALSKGVHVLVEKPIAQTVEQANEMIALAKENQLILAVGHIERFNPAVQKLKSLLDSGDFGEVTSLIARRVGGFPTQIKDANVVIDLAVHDIDIFYYLLGKQPTEVLSHTGIALTKGREDHAEIFLKYGSQSGFIQVNWITPVRIRKLVITGTLGYIEVDYINQKIQAIKSDITREYDIDGNFLVSFQDSKEMPVSFISEEPLKQELKHFLSVIRGETELIVSGEVGRDSLAVALDALRLAKTPVV